MGSVIGKEKTVITILVNGPIIILMDMANINGWMVIFMKENGKWVWDMAMAVIILLLETAILANIN